MVMSETARWDLPLLFAGQAQKEVYHNEALVRMDMLMHARAESADLAEPPEMPDVGQCWIVANGAVGAWSDHVQSLACWTEGGWRFAAPGAGLSIEVTDRGHALRYDGEVWRETEVRTDGIYIDHKRIIGPRGGPISEPIGGAVIDAECRAALGAILSALRAHGVVES